MEDFLRYVLKFTLEFKIGNGFPSHHSRGFDTVLIRKTEIVINIKEWIVIGVHQGHELDVSGFCHQQVSSEMLHHHFLDHLNDANSGSNRGIGEMAFVDGMVGIEFHLRTYLFRRTRIDFTDKIKIFK